MKLYQLKKQPKGKTPTDELDVPEGRDVDWLRSGLFYTKPNLSLPAKVYEVHRYRYPHKSEEEAMRGDWEKIGADLRVSIARAERETAAK